MKPVIQLVDTTNTGGKDDMEMGEAADKST